MAGVPEITYVHSHAGARLALAAKRQPSLDRCVFECAVTLISIQLVGLSVVRHQQVGPAALVIIQHCNAKRLGTAVENSAGSGNVLKSAAAAIVEQPARFAAIRFR